MSSSRHRTVRASLVGLWLALSALSPCVARASDLQGTSFLFPVEASRSWWQPPALSLNGSNVSTRLVGLPIPSDAAFYGISAGAKVVFFDEGRREERSPFGLTIEFLRLRLAWSGSRSAAPEPADGGVVSVGRGAEMLLEVGSPLLQYGVFHSRGHVAFGADLEWGWAYLWSRATTVDTTGQQGTGSLSAGSLFIHLAAAACLLSRPLNQKKGLLRTGEDVCVTLTPTVYEWGWFGGVSAGVRVDL